jgi:trans-aconitate methyltransferase
MRWVIDRFLAEIVRATTSLNPSSIVDLGCGEGIVAGMLATHLPNARYLGLDISPDAVAAARTLNPETHFEVANVLDPPTHPKSVDLALCLEVVEHLDDPDTAVARVMEWTSGHAILSVPWEPYFRIGNLVRGRHVAAWGNHPEHVQKFSPRSFADLLSLHSQSHLVWTCFPWIIGLVEAA